MSRAGITAAARRRPDRNPEFPHIRALVRGLADAGLRDVCISPGARSTPLTVSFTREPRLRCWSHADERSGAFFALGVAKATRTPAAVLCTSGTAAANFFPAVVEAARAGVPLIVITADRPPELRDREAEQTIDQIQLYGRYAKWFAEVGMADCGLVYFRDLARRAMREAGGVPAGVVHLNFPLREPLLAESAWQSVDTAPDTATSVAVRGAPPHPEASDIARLATRIAATPRGVILCGPADHEVEVARAIHALSRSTCYPILADPMSQLRRAEYAGHVVDGYDGLLAGADNAGDLAPDLALRFGKPPTSKRLRLWLEQRAVPQVVVEPRGTWNDPSGTSVEMWSTDSAATCAALCAALPPPTPRAEAWLAAWRAADGRARRAVDAVTGSSMPLSGVGLFARLADAMPRSSLLFTGNSLPIRQLEAVWPARAGDVRMLCNRGANGIDGVVSSILGAAAVSPVPVVGVLGDLSFYHDLNGLLVAKRRRIDVTIIVLNNDGGGIFSMLPVSRLGETFEEYFTTPHGLDFRLAAEMYGCAFDRVDDWRAFDDAFRRSLDSAGTHIIEIPIDRDEDVSVARRLTAAAARAAGEGGSQSVEKVGQERK